MITYILHIGYLRKEINLNFKIEPDYTSNIIIKMLLLHKIKHLHYCDISSLN